MIRFAFSILCVLVLSSFAVGQETGARSFAASLNASRSFHHDRSFGGAEVIFRSSGVATQQQAFAAWSRSPGHARLIDAGLITDVQCVGGVCVGRGGESSTVTRSVQTTRNRRFLRR